MGEYSKSAIIKYTRKALGMTQEELACSICDPVTLSRYENGQIEPPDIRFLRLMRKMGEKGDTCLFQVECEALEIETLLERILFALERQDWNTVEDLKNTLEADYRFSKDFPENRQYLMRIDINVKYNKKEIAEEEAITCLKNAWQETVKDYRPEEFPINRILKEAELLIMGDLATFYKLAGKFQKALVLYEYLDKYFKREGVVNDYKPEYLIYVGYTDLLGELERYDESIQLCFRVIEILLRNNQTNYLYKFYYNIAWNIKKKIDRNMENRSRISEAKMYAWLAYQLCMEYPEDKENLQKNLNTFGQL